MEELIYSAIPTKNYSTLIMLILVLITIVVFTYLVEEKKIKTLNGVYRQTGLLLGGLFSLIILVTTLFTGWHLQTIQPVKLYESYMETYQGKIPYKQISQVGIYNDKEKSLINAQVVIRDDHILVIEKKDNSVILFAEENYDIKKLVVQIRGQIEKKR